MREITQVRRESKGPLSVPSLPLRARFVGRDRELATLHELLVNRSGQSVLVQGEAGIGKSSLFEEFLSRVTGDPFRVLRGHCYEQPEVGPYFPFQQLARQISMQTLSPGRYAMEAIWATRAPGEFNLSRDAPAERAAFLNRATDAILIATSERKTLVCIEDIQWADVGSLLLLNNLIDARCESLSVACSMRTEEPLGNEVRQLVRRIERNSRRVLVPAFTADEVRCLMETLKGPGFITEEELDELHACTRGNPLFVTELILHLTATGLLERHSLAEALSRAQIPRRLAELIDLRLHHLPPRVTHTLSLCAVVGGQFAADAIVRIGADSKVVIERHLQTACESGIVLPVDHMGEPRYRFVHPLFAKRLYDRLSPAQRRDLHSRVAEAGHTGALRLDLDELARHHAAGLGRRQPTRVIHYCSSAAERAEGIMAFESAARFWELALRSTRTRSNRIRARLLRRLGWALWAAGKWIPAAEVWEEAVQLFDAMKDARHVGEIALALGDMLRWRQELAQSKRWLSTALAVLPEESTERARALALLGSIECIEGNSDTGLELLQEAVRALQEKDPDPITLYWLSYGFLTAGDPDKACSLAKEGLIEATRRGASNAVCLLAASLVHQDLAGLKYILARSHARILEAHLHPTDTRGLTLSFICKALIMSFVGDWSAVSRLCEEWAAKVRLVGRYQVATARVFRGEARLALGDAVGAKTQFSRALPDVERMMPLVALHLARAHLHLGESEQAEAILRHYAAEVIATKRFAAARLVAGDVASSLEATGICETLYEALLLESRPMLIVYAPISVQRVLGRLATSMKLWREAISHFDAAARQLAFGGAHFELAHTYLNHAAMRRARRRRGDLNKAVAFEARANAIFSKLGVPQPLQDTSGTRTASPFGLTSREMEVLDLVAHGQRNREIAETLGVTHRTVDRHLENILGKMAVSSRTQAVIRAVEYGLIGARSSVGERD
ncbi:MAG: AAA family ATPase [Dehalococcoidia bacterium]|nr:AAA family ATPase [Dehalococcoidia bacterium]